MREYVLHVVRQNNGPTYSSSVGTGTSTGSSGSTSSGPGSSGGPGVTKPSAGDDAGTPGGSNVTIAPDGSAGMSVQTSTGVMQQGPGTTIQVTEVLPGTTQAAGNPSAQSSSHANGDINGDGKVNSLDALKLQRYILGLETLSANGQKAADLNGDGKVNSQDILLLQKKILGL